jgi:hypothetical protein
MSLAIQKHGKDVTVRAIGAVATERRTERDLLVNTVTLLHGGVSSGTGFAAWLIPLGRSDIEQGRFDDEFVRPPLSLPPSTRLKYPLESLH